jgi:hypothetical protein
MLSVKFDFPPTYIIPHFPFGIKRVSKLAGNFKENPLDKWNFMWYNWNVELREKSPMNNRPFVEAVKREQEKRGNTQAEFANYIEISQGALSKFYGRGVRGGIVIKVLAKFPDLAHFFASGHSD